MTDKRTLESDRKLINVLFNFDPLDFARRDDGTLVIIHPDGKKTIHTPEEIAALSDKELAARSAASKRASREASGDARLSAASGRSTGGPTAAKKAAAAASDGK
jgi:hypothetical protein